jgi:hypothetical protein
MSVRHLYCTQGLGTLKPVCGAWDETGSVEALTDDVPLCSGCADVGDRCPICGREELISGAASPKEQRS